MAAEVGLALLTASLDVLFDRLASPVLLNFIKGKKLDQRLLHRFETKLCVVAAVLNDAEQKQIKDPFVKKWLDALKDAVYEADDLLDELSTRAATQKEVRNFFNLNFKDRKMGSKIEGIIQKLEEIAKHKDVLGLKNIAGRMLTERPKSTSPRVESHVWVREKDKEAIIDFLLSDDTSDGNKIGVIPIVGLGGIGKTTLAQLVYNDDRVKQKFNLRAWVCVSDDFDVSRIMRSIMEDISDGTCNKENPNSLQIALQEKLKEKKILIVLDDIWTERYTDWDPLRTLFHHGLQGSKIIVTTRSKQAASMVKTTEIHCLNPLSDKDCWLIFVRHASPSVSISNALLEEVRDDVTRKCKGLPLAAKILGGLLRSKSDIKDWKIVLKSDLWDSSESEDKGISALKVSYYYLPSHLKRCFIHCSLFPKDFNFRKEELILLWMAEGLLQPRDRNMTLEEVGCAYFEDLASRFFFQQSNNSQEFFFMHDLVHDLAESFAREFYRRIEIGGENNIYNQTRHMSFVDQFDLEFQLFKTINNAKALRTFLSISREHYSWVTFDGPKDLLRMLLSNCKCLRVLSFCNLSCRVLPNSIGKLVHLRYLNLSGTDIKSLPNSICKLHNLQILKLRFCDQLSKLPDDIQDLVNLRYLDVMGTGIEEMPIGIGKLKNLHYLSDFVVGKDKGSKIGELGTLSDLANKLNISNLQNVSNKGEISQAQMMDKKYIQELELTWNIHDVDDSQTEKDILEKLKPHTNLKGLSILGYMGTEFSH